MPKGRTKQFGWLQAPATNGIIRLRVILQGASAPIRKRAAKKRPFCLLRSRQNDTNNFAVGFALGVRDRLCVDFMVV